MANATHIAAEAQATAGMTGLGNGRLLGFVIVCLAPAAFWIGLIALAAWIFGTTLSPASLIGGAIAISGFLAVVFSALTFNPRS